MSTTPRCLLHVVCATELGTGSVGLRTVPCGFGEASDVLGSGCVCGMGGGGSLTMGCCGWEAGVRNRLCRLGWVDGVVVRTWGLERILWVVERTRVGQVYSGAVYRVGAYDFAWRVIVVY